MHMPDFVHACSSSKHTVHFKAVLNSIQALMGSAAAPVCPVHLVESEDQEKEENRKQICLLLEVCFSAVILLLVKSSSTPNALRKITLLFFRLRNRTEKSREFC